MASMKKRDGTWVRNVVDHRMSTGYITREDLIKLLRRLFPDVESTAEFNLKQPRQVSSSPRWPCSGLRIADLCKGNRNGWVYYAPQEVQELEYQ